jgi:hypothetical protein
MNDASKPEEDGSKDDHRKRNREEEDGNKRSRQRGPLRERLLSARLPIRTTASITIARTAALSPKNKAVTTGHSAPERIDVAEHHDADDAWQDEQTTGQQAASVLCISQPM